MLVGGYTGIEDCLGITAHDDPNTATGTPDMRHAIGTDNLIQGMLFGSQDFCHAAAS
jgi:hypothetical protein